MSTAFWQMKSFLARSHLKSHDYLYSTELDMTQPFRYNFLVLENTQVFGAK